MSADAVDSAFKRLLQAERRAVRHAWWHGFLTFAVGMAVVLAVLTVTR